MPRIILEYNTIRNLYRLQVSDWILEVISRLARYTSHNKYNLALTSQVPELTTEPIGTVISITFLSYWL